MRRVIEIQLAIWGVIACVILSLTTPAPAQQQQSDPAYLGKVIAALETQRNEANNQTALSQARVAVLTEELAKAQARIKELEPKPEDKK